MKIATLEKIHELLKNEHTAAQVNYTAACQEVIRCKRAHDDAITQKAIKAAEEELEAANSRRDELRARINSAEAALREFEAQEL